MENDNIDDILAALNAPPKWWERLWITRIFGQRFWKELSEDYPQTWPYMPRWHPVRAVIQWVCGLFGHTVSKTEWGSAGGDTVDVWCRWCGKQGSISPEEARFRWKSFNEIRPDKGIDHP